MHDTTVSLTYLLLLYLGLHHLELGWWGLLIGHQLLGVQHPAEQGLQGVLEPPTVQQGLLQLGCSLSHLQSCRWINLFPWKMKLAHQPPLFMLIFPSGHRFSFSCHLKSAQSLDSGQDCGGKESKSSKPSQEEKVSIPNNNVKDEIF